MNENELTSKAEESSDSLSKLDPSNWKDADSRARRVSVAELSGPESAHGQLRLENSLTRIAEYAVQAIPGADGVGLTLSEHGRPDTMVASADFVREVDAIQYGIGEGPCITAATEGRTVHAGHLEHDAQWPRFGPKVGALGVHSALSLPLLTHGSVVGALNVYAHLEDAFDERAVELGELFAAPAAVWAQNAQVLADMKRLGNGLHAALALQVVIDQAIGVLIHNRGLTVDEASERIHLIARARNQTTFHVARAILDATLRRNNTIAVDD